jgi:hypothetical protein
MVQGHLIVSLEGKSCLVYFEGTWSEWWYLMWDCSVQLLFMLLS